MRNATLFMLIFISSQLFSQIDTANYVFRVVQHMPEFPGGSQALTSFIQKNMKFPKSAKKEGIEGRSVVSFVVDTNGSVEDLVVLKKISPDIDKESLRIVSLLKFTPGTNAGRKVKVMSSVPINFWIDGVPKDTKVTDTIPHPLAVAGDDKGYVPAKFAGAESALLEYINKQNKYPADAGDTKLYVVVQVLISGSGQAINPQLKVAQLSGVLNSEALRIARSLPDFIPATKNGQPVDSYYVIPIPLKKQ